MMVAGIIVVWAVSVALLLACCAWFDEPRATIGFLYAAGMVTLMGIFAMALNVIQGWKP